MKITFTFDYTEVFSWHMHHTTRRHIADDSYTQQDRQCTYKVILRRVRVTIVVVAKQ